MVETKDDEEDKVVGTKDGSINIAGWTEKVWLDNKKSGTINDKILFLGPIKETHSLIPTLDMKFNSFGAFFGISGNQAILYADTKLLNKNDVYNAFLIKLSSCPIPEFLKEFLNKMGINTIKLSRTPIHQTNVSHARITQTMVNRQSYETIGFTMPRRGLIGVNKVGYVI